MRIGFDAKRAFHNFRGLGNYSRTLIEGQLEFYPDDQYHLFTPTFGDLRSVDWESRHPAAFIHTPQNFLAKLVHPLWRSFGMATEIQAHGIDIFHGLSHEFPYRLERAKVKTIVTIHDLIFLRYPEFFTWVDRRTYLRKLRYATRTADCIVAICEQTKQDLIDFMHVPASRIKVVYQSCSPLFYDHPDESYRVEVLRRYEIHQPYLLSVGALEARKNLVMLVEAFAELKDQVPHDLILVGNGKWEYRKLIEAAIARHGLASRVKFLPNVAQGELPSLYQSADLFVYPSLFEGFGIPIIEAMFCGLPVVTSQGSCFAESGGDAALYVDPKRVEDISDGMLKVLSDRDLHQKMSTRGKAYVQKFHLKETSKNMHKVYQAM